MNIKKDINNDINGNQHEVYACKKLLGAILSQAIIDLKKEPQVNVYPANTWFNNESDDIGSFIWICKVLDIHPRITKELILT